MSNGSLGGSGEAIDAAVRRMLERSRVPGAAVGVVRGGELTHAAGYGLANVELDVPVEPATIFQSGSIGKMFTATVVMLLVEEGRISLDASVAHVFPEAPEGWRAVTVRHLLTHTSGNLGDADVDLHRDYDEDELARIQLASTLAFSPGERFVYSNTGYVLLGILAHRASGRTYGEWLAERVFDPLGMPTAGVIDDRAIVRGRAAGYVELDGQVANHDWVSPTLNGTADGSLHVGLHDLVAWDEGVRAGAVLAARSWAEVFTPAVLSSGASFPYGFGWSLEELAGGRVRRHSGGWQGFSSHYAWHVDRDLSVIVLANHAGAPTARLADHIAAIVDPDLEAPPPIDPDPDPDLTDRTARLLREAAVGELRSEEFVLLQDAYIPWYREMLGPVGELRALQPMDRATVGDDGVTTYRATYRNRSFEVRVAIAPDGRVWELMPSRLDDEDG